MGMDVAEVLLYVHRNRRFIRDGQYGGGGRGRLLYLSLHCHHQSESCIKMGSDESRFNVSLTVRDKVTKTVSTDHN